MKLNKTLGLALLLLVAVCTFIYFEARAVDNPFVSKEEYIEPETNENPRKVIYGTVGRHNASGFFLIYEEDPKGGILLESWFSLSRDVKRLIGYRDVSEIKRGDLLRLTYEEDSVTKRRTPEEIKRVRAGNA